MRPILVLALLLAVSFAGCTDEPLDADSDAAVEDADGTLAGDASDDVESDVPMLPTPPDLWGEETELVLIDEDQNPMDRGQPGCYRLVGFGLYQCALIQLPEGTLLPHGTGQLRVDVDSGSSQGAGSLSTEIFQTAGRSSANDDALDGEPQSGTQTSWTFEMVPEDWDPIDAATSALQINVWNDGESGLLGVRSGPFHVTLTAIKDPDWEAVSPGPDPWYQNPLLVEENAMRLHDDNLSATFGGVDMESEDGGFNGLRFELQHPIPEGSSNLLVGFSYAGLECAPSTYCYLAADVHTPSSSYNQPHVLPMYDDGWTILQFQLPGVLSTSDDNEFRVYVVECDPAITTYQSLMGYDEYCAQKLVGEFEADVRVRAEAWRGEPDLAAFKERLGVS